jgi:hypothetical protein
MKPIIHSVDKTQSNWLLWFFLCVKSSFFKVFWSDKWDAQARSHFSVLIMMYSPEMLRSMKRDRIGQFLTVWHDRNQCWPIWRYYLTWYTHGTQEDHKDPSQAIPSWSGEWTDQIKNRSGTTPANNANYDLCSCDDVLKVTKSRQSYQVISLTNSHVSVSDITDSNYKLYCFNCYLKMINSNYLRKL